MESPTSAAASRVDFYGFLDRMRRPAAAGLFRSIKSFLASLSLDEPGPGAEADGARVQRFYAAMEAAFRENPLWADATRQDIDHALEGLEKYVMTKLFDRTFAASVEDAAADAEVSERIGLLQRFVRPEHLDIPKVLHNEASWLLAVKELQKINSFKSPRDKLLCIMNCCQVINNLLLNVSMSNDRTPSGADEFLPILIYITIKLRAQPSMSDVPPPPSGEYEEETARRRIFPEFMTRVAQFEELVDGGRRFLARFRQELVSEHFRRPPVASESDVMSEIVGSNCTGRMKSYLEAGCRFHCQNISNMNQLNSCEGKLAEHINEVTALLKELQCLVEAAHGATVTANLSAIEVTDDSTADSKINHESHFTEVEQKEEQPADQLDRDTLLVTVMILVHNMLKLDYLMQEKIVRSLSLRSSSTELESYCLMWDLRPYVDDDVMNLAWELCP